MGNFIDAKTLKLMFMAGANNLNSKKDWINELNVFPVPDGDTGTNMTLTVINAVKEVSNLDDNASIEEVGKKIAQGTLRGARGNSGVIMSQLCRGFSKELEGVKKIDKLVVAQAMDKAVATAYKAVMKPKEGTILTVAKAASSKAIELADSELSLEEYFIEINKYAEFILGKTPEMLPVLKEAGVVDSGGQGLLEFLKGAFDAYTGKQINFSFEVTSSSSISSGRKIDTSDISTSDIKFGYCTEFIIELEKEFTEKDEQEFKNFLTDIGDSIVCVNMDDIVKVHVHTNHPGNAIEKALTFGSLTNMKIDNMREEHNEKLFKEENSSNVEVNVEVKAKDLPKKEWGFVAVCAGDGLAKIFKGMSVDEIIEGGQTMNPSADDIVAAIDKVNAENVYVLPNNGNIIMAAQQASFLCEDKRVIVVPTKTVTQGITAVINFTPALSIDDNATHMIEAAREIKSAEITYAVRDTEIDGKKIHNGDYMGIGDGKMLAVGTDIKNTAIETIREMVDEDSELITIYYGQDANEDDANELSDLIEDEFDELDIEVTYGGQPVYYYIISVE